MARKRLTLGSMARAILLVTAALLLAAPAAEAATQRYATPGGATTGECPQNQPCDIYTAFMKAQANDEVIIGTGDYGSAAAPLPTHREHDGGPRRPWRGRQTAAEDLRDDGRQHHLARSLGTGGEAPLPRASAALDRAAPG